MDRGKIAALIKAKRIAAGMTQEQLATKIFVSEKAVSRWETGRGTPDISLLIPLSHALQIEVSELLNGEENKKDAALEELIAYHEDTKKDHFNRTWLLITILYVISVLVFLIYLRLEFDPSIELHYVLRFLLVGMASLLVVLANRLYRDQYAQKLTDRQRIRRLSQGIVFIYYVIWLFNMAIFARYQSVDGYQLIPFQTMIDCLRQGNLYVILINICGNFVIFMPLQYFMMELFGIRTLRYNALLSFLIVGMIEVVQYVGKIGVFDVDDLILCTSGMILFYVLYERKNKPKKQPR